MMGSYRTRVLVMVSLSTIALAESGAARRPGAVNFSLPSQSLGTSLQAVAASTRVNIAAPSGLIARRRAPALTGELTADEAVDRLLQGSGLHAEHAGGAIIVRADAGAATVPDTADIAAAATDAEVVVTGTRIRGAAVASTVIRASRGDIRDSGRSDLGQVVRDLPQSFGGGQNPGVGQAVPQASGINVGAASSINLRGLGSDATLTLLNGHRLPYSALLQSVDVSTIPVQIVDRIEVVPDGASALYGSDAIAGVANIILKRDYSGLEVGTTLGKATDGGDFAQQYGALAGGTWRGGGIVAAYEYGHSSQVSADQRSYGGGRPGLTLYPPIEHHSVVASAHAAIGPRLTASIDGFYNMRRSGNFFPTPLDDDPVGTSTHFTSRDRAYAVAPSLTYRAGGWRIGLAGSVGHEKVVFSQTDCARGTCTSDGSGSYRNRESSAELDGDGMLLALPGGPVKLALGTGVRRIGFERYDGPASTLNTRHTQDSYYVFGELSLPIVGPEQARPLLRSAAATAALRYERYPGIGQVATPKLGLLYGFSGDLDLRGTWGRSFRAPTLYQQWQPRSIYLFPPGFVGGAGYPPATTALIVLGGNPDLKPERAATWSAGAELHPRHTPGLTVGASYFSVRYRDRIVTPIQSLSSALTDPHAAGQVVANPSAAAVAAAVASGRFSNFSGQAFVPANVIAIVDNSSVNAGKYAAHGIDLLARYDWRAGASRFLLASDITYLASRRQLTVAQPIIPLTGTIFNPPHWRGKATATWSLAPYTLTAGLYRIGGVEDRRFDAPAHEHGMTTFDLTGRIRVEDANTRWRGWDLTVSVQNLFNAKPGLVRTTYPFESPYDSTNYSAIGRFVSLAVRRAW